MVHPLSVPKTAWKCSRYMVKTLSRHGRGEGEGMARRTLDFPRASLLCPYVYQTGKLAEPKARGAASRLATVYPLQ